MQSLKNGLQFNVSEGPVSSINPIPTDLFWPCSRLQRVGVKLSKSNFFWIGNYYLLTWNLAHLLSNLKTFKKAIKTFEYDVKCYTEVIIYQHFLQVTWSCLASVGLKALVLFFLCFLSFCKFQCHFCRKIYYGNILLHFGLERVKIHSIF